MQLEIPSSLLLALYILVLRAGWSQVLAYFAASQQKDSPFVELTAYCRVFELMPTTVCNGHPLQSEKEKRCCETLSYQVV